MRTTLNIHDDVLNEVTRLTRARTKTEAVMRALEDYVRRRRMSRLKSLSGRIQIRLDWRRLERAETAGRP